MKRVNYSPYNSSRRSVIDLLRHRQPHHLGQSHLDRIRVLERRERHYPRTLKFMLMSMLI
jgi:hypothetical protein